MEVKEYIENKKEFLKEKILSLKANLKLVIIQVGDNSASNVYIKGKIKDCAEIGIESELIKFEDTITEDILFNKIHELNNDKTVTGFIVQLPLPKHIDENKIKNLINPLKDVDGFNVLSKFKPATPKGILTFLEDINYKFEGKNALIIGRSDLVGKPMANLLLDKNMNVTIIHSKTKEDEKIKFIEQSDLIVVATGKINCLTNKYNFKENAYVIDVGINRVDGKLVGDCEKNLKVKFQTPVPGGVGLLTRLALLLNVVEAYENGI